MDSVTTHPQEICHPASAVARQERTSPRPNATHGGNPTAKLPPRLTIIKPRSRWSLVDLQELWQYRELLYVLTWRDIKIRYKQTMLGAAWTILQPLCSVIVFVLFFGRMGGFAAGVENYTLFVLAAVLPWTFFANAVTTSANSLVNNERLVTKTYFPRLLLPLASIGAAVFDFAVGLLLLVGGMIWAGVTPTPAIVAAPLLFLLLILTALAVGTGFAALIVAQRDFRHILIFGMQLWMFATPCLYLSADKIGPTAKQLLPLNPTYGILLNFRACLLGTETDLGGLAVSAAMTGLMVFAGLFYFRRVEQTLADVI